MDEKTKGPKFKKKYVSWMGRAEDMLKFLEAQGFTVDYGAANTEIIGWSHSYFSGKGNVVRVQPEAPKPKRWWEWW